MLFKVRINETFIREIIVDAEDTGNALSAVQEALSEGMFDDDCYVIGVKTDVEIVR